MNFTKHYFDSNNEQLAEGLLGDLVKVGAKNLYGKIKDKPKKIKDINKFVKKDRVTDVTKTLFDYMLNLTAADLLAWKRQTKGKGVLSKFVEGKKNVFIKDIARGLIPEGEPEEQFKNAFDLSDSFLPNEISIYKTTNGGYITFSSVSDPYAGPKLKPSQVTKLGGKLKNMKYFVSVDDKADKWFVDKTGKHYNQFLASRKSPSPQDMEDDLENLVATYEEPKAPKKDAEGKEKAEEKPKETKVVAKVPTWKYDIGKDRFNSFLSANKTKNLKSILGDNFETKEKINKSDKIADGHRYQLANGGVISIILTADGNGIMTMDDLGRDALLDKKLIDKNNLDAIKGK